MDVHYYSDLCGPPMMGDRAICGHAFMGDPVRASMFDATCVKCAALAECEDCGALIGVERAELRLRTCLACAWDASPVVLASHGDEDTGMMTVAVKPTTEDLVEVEHGRVLPTMPERKRRRDGYGRFSAGTRMGTGRTEPTRPANPMTDHWEVARASEPIPGEATPQRSTAGLLRGRVEPKGRLPQNPWDRGPRDAGRRDFEAPTESNAVRPVARAQDAQNARRTALGVAR